MRQSESENGEPDYYLGTLIYENREVKEIEFYYPPDVKWTCTLCGKCCKDMEGKERRVLLLEKDLKRIMSSVDSPGFFSEVSEGQFVGRIKMVDGECIFLRDNVCRVYEVRPLICRMYPFWVEKVDDFFVIGVDNECPGLSEGETLGEEFYKELLNYALQETNYR
jgi:Fe-S-cluster containining protein